MSMNSVRDHRRDEIKRLRSVVVWVDGGDGKSTTRGFRSDTQQAILLEEWFGLSVLRLRPKPGGTELTFPWT
jgi:hypothetical protein